MAKLGSNTTTSLREQWKALEARGRKADWEKADLLRRIRVACEAEAREFLEWLSDAGEGLGLNPLAARRCASMVDALALVDGQATWEAVGWSGVQRVLRIQSASERKAVVSALKKAGPLSQRGFSELLAAKAPSLKARAKAKPANEVLQAALMERKVLLDALRAIARDYSLIVDHTVSDEAKALIGTRESAGAGVTS